MVSNEVRWKEKMTSVIVSEKRSRRMGAIMSGYGSRRWQGYASFLERVGVESTCLAQSTTISGNCARILHQNTASLIGKGHTEKKDQWKKDIYPLNKHMLP